MPCPSPCCIEVGPQPLAAVEERPLAEPLATALERHLTEGHRLAQQQPLAEEQPVEDQVVEVPVAKASALVERVAVP